MNHSFGYGSIGYLSGAEEASQLKKLRQGYAHLKSKLLAYIMARNKVAAITTIHHMTRNIAQREALWNSGKLKRSGTKARIALAQQKIFLSNWHAKASNLSGLGYADPYMETEAFDDPEIDYHLGEGLYMEEDALEELDDLDGLDNFMSLPAQVMAMNPGALAFVGGSIATGLSLQKGKKAKGKAKKHAHNMALVAGLITLWGAYSVNSGE